MTPEYWRFSSAADETGMVKIAITHAAYAAIAAALPQGIDARPVEPAAGKVFVWLDGSLAGCLAALRRRGEDHSDVILGWPPSSRKNRGTRRQTERVSVFLHRHQAEGWGLWNWKSTITSGERSRGRWSHAGRA